MQIVRSFALALPFLVPSLDAQQVLTTDVDVPTILSGPTVVPALSASALGVSSIRTISVSFSGQNPGNYHVLMTVTPTNNPFAQRTDIKDWDGGASTTAGGTDPDAINCRGTGRVGTSDTNDLTDPIYWGKPIVEYKDPNDAVNWRARLAPSIFNSRSVAYYFPDLVVDEDSDLSHDGSTTRILIRASSGVFNAVIDSIVVNLDAGFGTLGEAIGAAANVFRQVHGPSNWLSWTGASDVSTRSMSVAGLVATALVNDGGSIRRKLFWHGYGPVDAGLVLRAYNFDDPSIHLYDASALAGTTFVVRSTPASPLGTEVARIDTCALSSAIVPAATGGPARFTMVTPFDMPMAGKLAVFLVGFPIGAPIPIPGFTGLLGLDPSSLVPFVVSPGSASGSSWAFAVPPLSPGLIHVQSVVLDPSTLGGFFSNRAVLDIR